MCHRFVLFVFPKGWFCIVPSSGRGWIEFVVLFCTLVPAKERGKKEGVGFLRLCESNGVASVICSMSKYSTAKPPPRKETRGWVVTILLAFPEPSCLRSSLPPFQPTVRLRKPASRPTEFLCPPDEKDPAIDTVN